MKYSGIICRSLTILSLLLLFSSLGFAQFSSELQGNVQDPSGAAIPNASLKILNTATNVVNTTVSDKAGIYRLVSLAPGNYLLTVTAPGFGTKELNVTLDTSQTLNVPVSMSVQQATQTVIVEGQGSLLNTAETRSQMTLETQALTTLPLPGRSMIGLVTLAPGVTGLGLVASGSPGSAADNYSTETQVDASANGRGSVNNLYIVDGLDVTSIIRPGVLNLTPNPDSTQEETTEVNNFSVDYARGASLVMRITTASGTGKYHGFASDYFTNQKLWAGTEFVHSYAPFHSNNISAGVGGPIVPHHQAFFFFSIEPLRSSTATGNGTYTFEDPAFIAWAKSNYPTTLGTGILSKYPATNASGVTVSQTAANVFPGTCGTAATAFVPCSLALIDTGVFNSTNFRNGTQYNVRIDKYFPKDRVYGNFYRTTLDTGSSSIRPGFAETNHFTQWSIQGNETHTFSPNTLNEGSISFTRIEGIQPQTGNFEVPAINVTGINSIGDGFALGDFTQKNYHWRDVLTHIQGSHDIRVGYDGLKPDDIANFSGPYSQPTFTFNNLLNLVQDAPFEESGVAYNPLTGLPKLWLWSTTEVTAGVFAEDTWKVKKNLTITYGLRWDDFGNPYGVGAIQTPNFHLGAGQTPDQQVANGSILSTGHILNHSITNILSPRVGVAWDPTGSSTYVVHGGFGIYRQWPTLGNLDNSLVDNPPNYIFPTFRTGTTINPVFSVGTSQKPPFGYSYPVLGQTQLDSKGGLQGLQISVGGEDPNLNAPYTYTFAATLERKLTGSLVASIGYAGSHSNNLMTGSGQESATSYGLDINRFAGDLVQNVGVLTRLNHSFGAITYSQNEATANYNALILAVQGRFAKRGFVMASYTHSSSNDSTQVYPNVNVASYYGRSVWDAPNRFSLVWNYELPGTSSGRSVVGHLTNGWTLSGTTILQSGYPFTVSTNAAFQPIITNGVVTGLLPGSGDYNADGDNLDYPNVSSYSIPGGRQAYLNGLFGNRNAEGLFNSFSTPALGTEGNEKYDGFNGPGYEDTDIALLKNTQIHESLNLQLRFEFYNIFNHPNLNGVDSNLPDGNFGKSTSQFNPRWIQLGAKLQF
jgi:hypothetical protein